MVRRRPVRAAPGWSTRPCIAKIHTVEWTPAVISHPTTQIALRANWWGLAGERLHKLFGRLSDRRSSAASPAPRPSRPLRRAVLAHRGVRGRLPDAPADPRRLRLPLRRRRPRIQRAAPSADLTGPAAPRDHDQSSSHRPALLLRHHAPGAGLAAQLPALSCRSSSGRTASCMDLAAIDILRTRELGVPALQRLPAAAAPDPAQDFEDPHRQPGLGRADPAGLRRRHRARRPDGRHVRRARPEGLRVQRHRVPHLRR